METIDLKIIKTYQQRDFSLFLIARQALVTAPFHSPVGFYSSSSLLRYHNCHLTFKIIFSREQDTAGFYAVSLVIESTYTVTNLVMNQTSQQWPNRWPNICQGESDRLVAPSAQKGRSISKVIVVYLYGVFNWNTHTHNQVRVDGGGARVSRSAWGERASARALSETIASIWNQAWRYQHHLHHQEIIRRRRIVAKICPNFG